jgi:hypothetical protein
VKRFHIAVNDEPQDKGYREQNQAVQEQAPNHTPLNVLAEPIATLCFYSEFSFLSTTPVILSSGTRFAFLKTVNLNLGSAAILSGNQGRYLPGCSTVFS